MEKQYVILNGERSDYDAPVWWKAESLGYTNNIVLAGVYDTDTIRECSLGTDDIVIPVDQLPGILVLNVDALKPYLKK